MAVASYVDDIIESSESVFRTRAKRNRSLALIKKIQSRVDTLLQYQEPLQQKLKRLGRQSISIVISIIVYRGIMSCKRRPI